MELHIPYIFSLFSIYLCLYFCKIKLLQDSSNFSGLFPLSFPTLYLSFFLSPCCGSEESPLQNPRGVSFLLLEDASS